MRLGIRAKSILAHLRLNPQSSERIQKGTLVGGGTGTPGTFILKLHSGCSPEAYLHGCEFKLRLVLHCVGGVVSFRDLFELLEWNDHCPEGQIAELEDAFYHVILCSERSLHFSASFRLGGTIVNHDASEITKTILEIENTINARWNNGDCTGFLEAYREDVTYFDPLTDRCLIGRQAVKEHFDKYFTGTPVVRSEQFDPMVVINDAGDIAILTYNLQNHLAGENGELQPIPFWNCTQVYRLAKGKWNIAHNHWSFARLPAVIGSASA